MKPVSTIAFTGCIFTNSTHLNIFEFSFMKSLLKLSDLAICYMVHTHKTNTFTLTQELLLYRGNRTYAHRVSAWAPSAPAGK